MRKQVIILAGIMILSLGLYGLAGAQESMAPKNPAMNEDGSVIDVEDDMDEQIPINNMESINASEHRMTEPQQGAMNDTAAQGEVLGAPPAETIAVNNRICPVSKEKIPAGKEFKVSYNGKTYNLCCGMCEKDFKKNSDKYSKIAEDYANQGAGAEK